MKRRYSIIFSMIFSLILPLVAFASESATLTNVPPKYEVNVNPETNNYIRFGGKERIASDGTFTFNVYGTLKSSNFKVSSTSININATANAVDSANQGKAYYISLYKGSTLVKKVTYYCDGNEWGYTFTGLSTSATYHMEIDSALYTVKGSGSISNYVAP